MLLFAARVSSHGIDDGAFRVTTGISRRNDFEDCFICLSYRGRVALKVNEREYIYKLNEIENNINFRCYMVRDIGIRFTIVRLCSNKLFFSNIELRYPAASTAFQLKEHNVTENTVTPIEKRDPAP
ncbi:hypothetical protein PUN28_005882 [Cardiocondyla obscurior]|uniref:Galectin n=1 Tax=Cardiocondyla obscurior TaxID=286306 RepID=A0AAW2G911_9HYME